VVARTRCYGGAFPQAGIGKVAARGLAALPREITAEVARCLALQDFAAVSAASSATLTATTKTMAALQSIHKEVERLQDAQDSALQLQALMDVAMESSFDDDLDIMLDRAEASGMETPLVASSMLLDTSFKDMHELQRHCEIDALLEELRLQTEQS